MHFWLGTSLIGGRLDPFGTAQSVLDLLDATWVPCDDSRLVCYWCAHPTCALILIACRQCLLDALRVPVGYYLPISIIYPACLHCMYGLHFVSPFSLFGPRGILVHFFNCFCRLWRPRALQFIAFSSIFEISGREAKSVVNVSNIAYCGVWVGIGYILLPSASGPLWTTHCGAKPPTTTIMCFGKWAFFCATLAMSRRKELSVTTSITSDAITTTRDLKMFGWDSISMRPSAVAFIRIRVSQIGCGIVSRAICNKALSELSFSRIFHHCLDGVIVECRQYGYLFLIVRYYPSIACK